MVVTEQEKRERESEVKASSLMTARLLRVVRAALCGIAAVSGSAFSQTAPPDASDYTRTTHYTYNADGMLATSTVEKDHDSACYVTTYGYDPVTGNANSTKRSNCNGTASGDAAFVARTTSSTFSTWSGTVQIAGSGQSVSVVAGIFQDTVTDALGHTTTLQTDPRFGVTLSATNSNGVNVSTVVDDFGRPIRSVHADGTMDLIAYCLLQRGALDTLQTSNSSNCPNNFAAGEVPVDAVGLVYTVPVGTDGTTQIGPYTKDYSDRLGRTIRHATQGFDGPNQPGGRQGALVVTDTVYTAYGAKVLMTQPYFLASGSSTLSGSDDVGVTRLNYDRLGRMVSTSIVDPKGMHTDSFEREGGAFGYGSYGATRSAAVTTNTYTGTTTRVVNDQSQAKVEIRNALGQLLRVEDTMGAQLAYLYDGFGNLIQTVDALQNTVKMSYDWRGHRLRLDDPDKGMVISTYDALGELKSTQNAKQRIYNAAQATTYTYDAGGRVTTRGEYEGITTWYYDKSMAGSSCAISSGSDGQLCEVTVSTGLDRRYVYDKKSRLLATRLDTGASVTATTPAFMYWVIYDSNGRVRRRSYPSGVSVAYNYTALGYLNTLSLPSSVTSATVTSMTGTQGISTKTFALNQVLWQANAVNAWGGLEGEQAANDVVTQRVFEPSSGRLLSIKAGRANSPTSVQNQSMAWDALGNLTDRVDENGDGTQGEPTSGAVGEHFEYDSLNRLDAYAVMAPGVPGYSRTVNLQYNALGMVLYKSDVGNYSYPTQGAGSATPHAAQNVAGTSYIYDDDGNLKSAQAGKYARLTYTQFDMVASAENADGSIHYDWNYDESHVRVKETRIDRGNTRTTFYVNPGAAGELAFEYEINTGTAPNTVSARTYLTAWGHAVGMVATSNALDIPPSSSITPVATDTVVFNKVEFWHTDHLGSIVATTDHNGDVTQRYAYDPFGKRRQVTGAYDEFGTLVLDWDPNSNKGTARGFTGHEELDDIGIVNMNGRIYDATLIVFMQGDRHVTDPGDLQSYNRYAYARNNPLNGTDPTGFDEAGDPGLGRQPISCMGAYASCIYGPPNINSDAVNQAIGTTLSDIKQGIFNIVNSIFGTSFGVGHGTVTAGPVIVLDPTQGTATTQIDNQSGMLAQSFPSTGGRDPSGLGSALLDTLKVPPNVAFGLAEAGVNLLTGALPGFPDYVPFLSGARFQYDTPIFGVTVEMLTGIGAAGAIGELSTLAGRADEMGSFTATGSDIFHGPGTTRIGSDAVSIRVSENVAPIDGVHDVVVHGVPYDKSGAAFLVDDFPTNARQIADAVRENPSFGGQPIRLLTCYGGCGSLSPAQELSNILNVPVLGATDKVGVARIPGSSPVVRNGGSWINFQPQ